MKKTSMMLMGKRSRQGENTFFGKPAVISNFLFIRPVMKSNLFAVQKTELR